MAENEQQGSVAEGLEEKPKSKLIPMLILVNVLVLGGFGLYMWMTSSSGEADAQEAAQPEPMGPIVPLKGFTVNLNDRKGTKYLKLVISVELKDAALNEVVVERDAIMRHNANIYLASLKTHDVQGPENQLNIAENLKKRLNDAIGLKDGIKQVLLTEIRWQ